MQRLSRPERRGGHGPSLVAGRRVNDLTDAQLLQSIQKGVPGTDMPPSSLPEPQLKQVVAFVKSLGAPAIDTVVPVIRKPGAPVERGGKTRDVLAFLSRQSLRPREKK
jgi:hypothetical protein